MQLMWSRLWTNTIHSCFWINKTLFKLVYKEFCMPFWMLIRSHAEAKSLRSAQVSDYTVSLITPFWTWASFIFLYSKLWLPFRLLGLQVFKLLQLHQGVVPSPTFIQTCPHSSSPGPLSTWSSTLHALLSLPQLQWWSLRPLMEKKKQGVGIALRI